MAGDEPGVPSIPLQEHFEKLDALRDQITARLTDKIEAERDLRYQQRSASQDKAVETALLAAEKAINAALTAQEKAVIKAEAGTARSFEGANEWRQTYGDRDRLQVPRIEYAAGISNLAEKIDDLARDRDRGAGRQLGQTAAIGAIVTAILVGSAILGLILKLLP